MPTLNIRVAANGDDCCIRSSGSIYLSSIAVGADAYSYRGGFRFLNITIPNGSVINTAYLTLTAGVAGSNDTVRLKLKGEQNNNASGFSTYADFTGRTETTAGVDWDFTTDWVVDSTYNSPEIKSIIQELVDDYSGLSGANIVIFVDDDGSDANATRSPYDYNESTTKCALLHIEYTLAVQTLLPSSIPTSESIGTTQLNFGIKLSGIASSEIFGSHELIYVQNLLPSGIISAEALGTSKFIFFLSPSGIDSGEAIGDLGLSATITPSAILTAEVVGQPILGHYHIAGTVTLLGVGVTGAIVRAINQVTGDSFETETDLNGNYNMALNTGDTYHIAVEYESGGQKYNALSKWDVLPV